MEWKRLLLVVLVAIVVLVAVAGCDDCETDYFGDGVCDDDWGDWKDDPTAEPEDDGYDCKANGLGEIVCTED